MVTASDLRAAIARRNVPIYKVAAAIDLHPGRLSAVLHEKLPLTPELAVRISEALHGQSVERRNRRG